MKKKTKKIVLIISIIAILVALAVLLVQRKTDKTSQVEGQFAQAIINTKIGNTDYNITEAIETNPIPKLSAGMIPIKRDGDYWIISNTSNWCDYSNDKPAYMMLNDGKYQSEEYYKMPSSKKIAKGKAGTQINDSELGTVYVWIPKFAYIEDEEGQTQTEHIKEDKMIAGSYITPDCFKYKEQNIEFSLSGIWVELNELQTEKETRDKVTELNKGESDTKYGFIANTKASKMTEDEQKIIKIYQKNINTNIVLNSTNYTILKIIDVNKQEPIQNATAVYDPITGRITVNVTGAINGISKIVDENGEELDYPDANDKTTAITKEETLIGNGV